MASAKGNPSRDWGKGFAVASRQKVSTTVSQNRFGPIPGVEVGTLWKFRRQASEAGVHRPCVAGIHGWKNEGVYSIVLSGSYEDDEDNGDSFTYTGFGGSGLSGNRRTAEQLCDQQLTRMNRVLAMNCNAPVNMSGTEAKDWKGGKPVRVIRNAKGRKHSKYAPEDGNRYDGIYKIVKYWQAKGKSGFKVWRYLLQRDDPTPAPWTAEGKKRIEQLGLTMQYPVDHLEAQKAKESDLDQNDTSKTATKDKTKKRKKSLDDEAERSVRAFFEAQLEGDSKVLKDSTEPESVVTFDSKLKLVSKEGIVREKAPKNFCFITWNIDGLDEKNLRERTEAVARTIEKEKADIVFLQEVIPTTCQYLKDLLPQYTFLTGSTEDYFAVTLLRRTTVHFDGQTVVPFKNTVMGRNLLCVEAHIGDLKLQLLNAHLESTGEFTSQRVEQLKLGFGKMKGSPSDVTTIFAGDLNLRDNEVVEAGLPPGVVDVWEACGKGLECRYTWDTTCNTNKEFSGRFKPRLRFDRVYLRTPTSPNITTALPRHFGLVGLKKVTNTQSFPSDHWGIIIHYETLTEEKKQMKELMGFSSFHTTKGKYSYALWGVTCSDGKKREDLPDFEEYNKWQMKVK